MKMGRFYSRKKHLFKCLAKSNHPDIVRFGIVQKRNVSNALPPRNQPQPRMITLSLKTF